MPTSNRAPRARLAAAGALALSLGGAGAAQAQDDQGQTLVRVERELARQAKMIEAQQQEIDDLRADRRAERSAALAGMRAAGAPDAAVTKVAAVDPVPNAVSDGPTVTPVNPSPGTPVGERPAEETKAEVAAIPAGMSVLTPRGSLILDPSIEYVRSSNNRLVFRGVEIVPGVQLGVIEASDVAQDTGVATLAARYGLTSRLEVEARVPYVWRNDRVTTLAQKNDTLSRSMDLSGADIGDVELAARYQLNSGAQGGPIFLATSRVKPPTGTGPYDVKYDQSGVAQSLATGSGFWAAEAGVTMLYPTDPAIIFGGLTYLHNFSRDIDRTIGSGDAAVHVGRVEPGDSIGASLGFGLALNPRFSVSLGYSHSYIFKTYSELGDTRQSSQPLQVGSLLMGWSFRMSEKLTLNNSFEFGVTSDAPDVRIVFRAPYRF